MASYKKQLGWDDGGSESSVDKAPQTNRRPWFTVLALIVAIATASVSASVVSGAPSGYGGWGAVFAGVIIGFVGAPVALILCLVALVREKKYFWVNLISIAICLTIMLWLYNDY